MKIPKKIKIGCHTYDVSLKSSNELENRYNGICLVDTLKIVVNDKCGEERMKEFFLHEILHACFHNASMDTIDAVKDSEEYIIDALSKQLYQVLKDIKLSFE